VAIVCGAGSTDAADAPAPNAEAARLVRQLSDDSATVRHNAAWRLRDIGIPALPALKEAANSDDPEVQAAARAAIKAIGGPLPAAGSGPYTTKVNPTDPEYFSVDFSDGKRVVRIEGECQKEGQASPHHLKMTFTAVVDGKETTQIFTAENEDDLKWNSPQAWKYYHSIFNREREMAAVRVPHDKLIEEVNAAMNRLKFSAAERKQVQGRLQRFADASARALAATMYDPDNAPKKMAEEFRESDSLRKFLTEKKLPIVDWELSPPPEERLGIYFYTDPKFLPNHAQSGLLVKFVASGERADRIGVRAGDLIQRIDGVEIDSARQLRPACLAKPAGMTIEVSRNGQPVTLQEKANAAPASKP